MKFVDVWITCPSSDVAERIAEALVGSRLAACANVFGKVRSIYRWRGDIERESEVPLLVKAREEHFDELAARVSELHPYDVPAVIAVPIGRVNADYGDWLVDATEKRD